MKMLLTVEHIEKYHNEKCILKDVSFSIEEHDKMALIGVNGTGKTTFLKILAGLEHYDAGRILQKNGLRVAYLAQEPMLNETCTILEQVLQNVQNEDGETKAFEAKAILGKLGIPDSSLPISILSGGQRKRVALAEVLLRPCDLLLLDEPTNHLDNDMIEWLEAYLIRYNKAVFMVTHDRYFLEHITNAIIEIHQGEIYRYSGNYSTYLEEKQIRNEQAQAKEKKRQNLLRKELEWVRAGVQARGTKSRDRLERFEKLNAQKAPTKETNVAIQSVSTRLGKKTIEFHDISKNYDGNTLFQNLSYNVKRNDRIGILGPNGCGKSTLLKVLCKEIAPDKGEVIYGDTVKIGFFKQGCEEMDGAKRVIDYIKDVSDDIETIQGHVTASQMLETFLFDAKMQYARIDRLSGGERRRLYLLKVLMEAPNILFLDEPTNDFDIDTLQILEDYLDSFNGAIFVVSHDRYFLDRICDTMFVFVGNGVVKQTIGGYSQYMQEKVSSQRFNRKETAKSYQEEKQRQRSRIPSLNSKEKRELETIDQDIASLEEKMKELDTLMDKESDFTKLTALSNEREMVSTCLEERMERWMELQEKQQAVEEWKKTHGS